MSAPASGRQPGTESDQIPARDIVAILFDTSRRLCLQSDRLLGATIGLSEARARLLVTVSELEPARMGRLASDLGVSPRSVTSMVDALERDGLITREPDPEDRRATLLRLTADSRARMSRLFDAQHQLAEDLLAPLGEDDRANLHRMLSVLWHSAGPDGAPRSGRPGEVTG
ncbi:MarR family winged helix-turn-helix transcriptional regulator [Amycolatopsis sp. YIM 10]|uniref:MarR family winged helix-turn-helix transcriptional regulator n=1 Tax=Amycolatopsis sp. YIM 10 TaxID=2653857 RepID=UPI0012905BDC|nr:MarR family transcriptional regulator [Amycolatopsis sp. YIM 10]QFU93024.1 transcriptional repressor MprA [Amycolatopsis sp. YIM 10]